MVHDKEAYFFIHDLYSYGISRFISYDLFCILRFFLCMYIIWLAQLNEQKTTLNQQSSFVDKVMGDKKNLVTKKTTLEEQVYTYISTFIQSYIYAYMYI